MSDPAPDPAPDPARSRALPSVDVAIIGGGVIGAAVACWLKAFLGFPGSVAVIERDPSHAHASTALSAAGIRAQFSTPANIALSLYGMEVLRAAPELLAHDGMRPDLNFHEDGYLFLAATEAQEAGLRAAHATQVRLGADVALIGPEEIAARHPHLRVDDIRLGSLGLSGEGWFDNMGLLTALSALARAHGARFLADEATGLEMAGDQVQAVRLASGARLPCGMAVNAAGPRAAQVAAWAGITLAVEPRKRTLFVFDCARPPSGRPPMTIDPSGVFCRPEGRYFLAGAPPAADPAVAHDDFDPRHEEFEEIVWPALAARSEAFEAIKPIRFWAGQYAWHVLDQNAVIGAHPAVANLIFANGFSGHGLQHAAGVGRAVAELIAHGAYRSLDLSDLGWSRVLENRPLKEDGVV